MNFTDALNILQEYTKLPNGEWVLTTDDMTVELSVAKFLTKAIVIRTTRMTDYAFDPIPDKRSKARQRLSTTHARRCATRRFGTRTAP
mgnify:CR=1 FL=1